jgi:ribonuclease P protein subunit RPR2
VSSSHPSLLIRLSTLSDTSFAVLGSSSHKHALVLKCVRCGHARRMPAPEWDGWDGHGRWNVGDGEVGAEEMVVVEKETEKEENPTIVSSPTENEERQKLTKKCEKKHMYPPLPLSARRGAGHVVFRGDEKVEIGLEEINQVGDGVLAV